MIEGRARTLADEARANDKEVVVPDLKAYERRLMHLELKDDPYVETYSEGEGDDRVLVISPVD
jgi:spoIIIJ-associated protein